MPNLYVTPTEIKDQIPDLIQASTTKYDEPFLRICNDVSRFIDRWCRRVFYPRSETRYFDGNGKTEQYLPDFFSISAIEYSEDDGKTYTAIAESNNWFVMRGDDHYHPGSYNKLVIDPNGTVLGAWPSYRRALKITAIWAYADDRSDAWEDSEDEVENNPLAAGGTTLTVNDSSAAGYFGVSPRLHLGLLLRIESEYVECISATGTDTLGIVRGRNGTTAAEHVQNKQIDVWRPPEPVKQAAAIIAVRQHQRAIQGFADSRANVDIGEYYFLRKIDPEAQELLTPYRLRKFW